MLQVDLNEPDEAIAQFIKARCAGFGKVVSVTVHRSPTPFALVLMADASSTTEITGRYGESTFGSSVLVHLKEKPDTR
jgi:hypothetical protein